MARCFRWRPHRRWIFVHLAVNVGTINNFDIISASAQTLPYVLVTLNPNDTMNDVMDAENDVTYVMADNYSY